MSYEDNLIDTTANIITYSVGYGIFRTYILPILILIILIVIAIYLYSINKKLKELIYNQLDKDNTNETTTNDDSENNFTYKPKKVPTIIIFTIAITVIFILLLM